MTCLSWNNLEGRHWTGPAFWYCSIVLAILAVILGSQQYIIFEAIQPGDWKRVQKNMRMERDGTYVPELTILWILQSPMMAVTYSIVFFFSGLLSHIVSPVARNMVWDGDAKVSEPELLRNRSLAVLDLRLLT
jgi:hypothetical protein